MQNPWIALPRTPPYVLENDHQSIIAFNKRVEEQYQIHLELLPEPYLGNPMASVVLLNLNPGFKPTAIEFHQGNDYFITTSRLNLLHGNMDYPFHLLDQENSEAPGHRWWMKKLRYLIDLFGSRKIANEVFCVELFPYHSRKFKSIGRPLLSQTYSFELVRKALNRNALIVVMRAREKWLKAIPELSRYPFYELNSPQNVTISKKNLPLGFEKIVTTLNSKCSF